jgi:F-type H+-transporting ATPase subunit b
VRTMPTTINLDRHQARRARYSLLSVVLLALALPSSSALAQESGSSPQSATSSSADTRQQVEKPTAHRPSNAAEMNRESRESAGESENAQFKHSASVRKISKLTGLTVDQVYWLSVGVNFGVIVGLIIWASKKNLPGMFRNRTAQIQKAMQEARKASEDANRRLADIEARLSRLDAEIGEMRSAAEQEAAAEEARIRAAAEEDSRRIVESAELEIAAAAKSARRELTAYAASLAVSLAEKQIHVDRNTDEALLRDFERELSASGKDGH